MQDFTKAEIIFIHLYTHQENERDYIIKNTNWIADKGMSPVFYTASKPMEGGRGIYRAYKAGKQHYCSKNEYDYHIKNNGWSPNNNDNPYWYTN